MRNDDSVTPKPSLRVLYSLESFSSIGDKSKAPEGSSLLLTGFVFLLVLIVSEQGFRFLLSSNTHWHDLLLIETRHDEAQHGRIVRGHGRRLWHGCHSWLFMMRRRAGAEESSFTARRRRPASTARPLKDRHRERPCRHASPRNPGRGAWRYSGHEGTGWEKRDPTAWQATQSGGQQTRTQVFQPVQVENQGPGLASNIFGALVFKLRGGL